MARKKTRRNAETIVYNGFRFANDLYIKYSYNTATKELTAVAETSDGEITGTVTLAAPEPNPEPTPDPEPETTGDNR